MVEHLDNIVRHLESQKTDVTAQILAGNWDSEAAGKRLVGVTQGLQRAIDAINEMSQKLYIE